MTEGCPDGFIQRDEKGKITQGRDTQKNEESQGQQFNRKLVLQFTDVA